MLIFHQGGYPFNKANVNDTLWCFIIQYRFIIIVCPAGWYSTWLAFSLVMSNPQYLGIIFKFAIQLAMSLASDRVNALV